ncbi:MAG: TonB-dependent receptor domain-containing protein [Blastocatellia bacterium]
MKHIQLALLLLAFALLSAGAVTWIKGRHTLKMGAQLYQNQFWYISSPNLSGDYTFTGQITGGVAGQNNPINALADFLLGAVKTANIPVPQIPVNRHNYNLGLFVNDDWKLTSKLTLNLGLRYEFETKQAVKNNIYSRVDLKTGDLLVADRNASKNLNLENDYLAVPATRTGAFEPRPHARFHGRRGL